MGPQTTSPWALKPLKPQWFRERFADQLEALTGWIFCVCVICICNTLS
uniref:Uncharacterized protein n=1 Tax=Stegastes partitus TaxID=144197 RepID=A0A3B5AEX0_9TELE